MVDEVRRCALKECALPGCDVRIRIAEGRPERRYCTAAHRAAARHARRAAMRDHAAAPAALPWLDDAAPAGPGAPPAGALRADVPLPDGGRPAPPVSDARRRGDELGGYRADGEPVVAGPVLRPVARHGTPAEPGAVSRAAASRSRGTRRDGPRPRRRTLALLGMAGILAGGYGIAHRPESPEPPAQTASDTSPDAWAQRASLALASVNRQLDILAQAEDEWKALPSGGRGDRPPAVVALEERRAELQRRRAAQNAKGWQPASPRKRKVSAALKAYAMLTTSAAITTF